MTITPYHLDSVLNAYTRQSKVKLTAPASKDNQPDHPFKDVVSLSPRDESKSKEIDLLSYTLRDVILRGRDK